MPDFKDVATLTKQVNNNVPARRFLSSFFAPEFLKTIHAELDTVENSRTLAPFKREGAKMTTDNRGGYTKRPFHCYEIGLQRPTTAFDVFKAQPGEPAVVNDPMDPNARQAYILGQDSADLNNKINRTIEKLSSDALFNGGYKILDEDGNQIDSIDFGFKSTHKITKTGDDRWGKSGAKIITDLEKLDTIVGEDSGKAVMDKVFGSDVWATAQESESFMKAFDRINQQGNSVNGGAIRNGLGARLVGYYNGSRIWVYDEVYFANGQKYSFVPKDKILAIGEGASLVLYYGCVGNVKDGWFMGERFAKTRYDEDEETQLLIMKSRPLPVIREADAVAWAKVL